MIKCDNTKCPYYNVHNDIVNRQNTNGICGDDETEVKASCKYYLSTISKQN